MQSHEYEVMDFGAYLVGDSKSFVAREAMERSHGQEACLVG